MTIEEAAVVLGLDPEATFDAAAARRAYLKAIKRHKPESDPEGFKRVRAAYEVLTAYRTFVATVVPAPAPPPADPPPSPAPSQASPPPQPGPAQAAVVDLLSVRRRLAELPARPWQPRVALAREAHQRAPTDPQVRELLIQELALAGQMAEVVAVLRAAAGAGDRLSLLRLVGSFPTEATEAELERLRGDGSSANLLLVAAARVGRDEPDLARSVVEEALAALPVESVAPPLVHRVLVIVLELHQRGLVPAASQVWTALSRALGPEGLRAAGVAHHTAIYFLFCSELERVPELPRDLREGVARTALTGDPSWAVDALEVFARYDGARTVKKVLAALNEQAPNVRRLLGPLRFDSNASVGLTAIALVVVGALFWAKFSTTSERDPALPPAHGWPTEDRHREYLRLCRDDFETVPCRTIDGVFATLGRRNGCQELPARHEELQRVTAGATGPMKDYLQELSRFMGLLCKGE
jgi:hypothetical protein